MSHTERNNFEALCVGARKRRGQKPTHRQRKQQQTKRTMEAMSATKAPRRQRTIAAFDTDMLCLLLMMDSSLKDKSCGRSKTFRKKAEEAVVFRRIRMNLSCLGWVGEKLHRSRRKILFVPLRLMNPMTSPQPLSFHATTRTTTSSFATENKFFMHYSYVITTKHSVESKRSTTRLSSWNLNENPA